jgi:hypothetical protein
MCNLKLNDNQVKKKQVDDFGVVLDDFSSADSWIIEREKHVASSNFNLFGVIDSARKKNYKENESNEEKNF